MTSNCHPKIIGKFNKQGAPLSPPDNCAGDYRRDSGRRQHRLPDRRVILSLPYHKAGEKIVNKNDNENEDASENNSQRQQ